MSEGLLEGFKPVEEDITPKGDELKGNEPKGDEPKGDEPKGDEPKGDEPKGDEPKGDEPKGDEPKGDEPKGDEPKGDEPKIDNPNEDYDVVDISEMTGGEFETIEQLINDRNTYKENVITGDNIIATLDEQSEEIFGMTYADIVSFKNEDYDGWSDLDVIAELFQNENEGATDREVRSELREFRLLDLSKEEQAEMIENEKITQDDLDDLEAKLDRKARNARASLKEFQETIDLSEIKLSQNKSEAEPKVELTPEEVEENNRRVAQTLSDFKGIKFNLGAKGSETDIPITPNDSDLSRLEEMVNSQTWLADRWKGEDGEINGDLAFKDMFLLENQEKIAATLYNEGVTAGQKMNVKEEDNITLGGGKGVPDTTNPTGLTSEQKIARDI